MRNTTRFLLEYFLRCRLATTDSRDVLPGAIFFALKGGRFNGNVFARGALDVGAGLAVVDDPDYYIADDDRYIWVEDALKAMQDLATAYRNTFDIPLLGITGSNGKTTTKELIHAVLSQEKQTHATYGNLNNHIGVPLTLLRMPPNTEIGIIEMGANQPGDIAELCEIARPNLGLITNIGKAHLERLISLEGVMQTKGALYDSVMDNSGKIFVNQNDRRVTKLGTGKSIALTYGHKSAHIYGKILSTQLSGMDIELVNVNWKQSIRMKTHLSGMYNLLNIEAAVAVGAYLGISIDSIIAGISSYVPQNQRSQVLFWNEIAFWMDAYNANPSSMRAAVDHVFQIPGRKVALVLGDMLEVGKNERQEHEDLGRYIASQNPFVVIGVGPLMKYMVDQYPGKAEWFQDIDTGKMGIRRLIRNADLVLLKGSRGMKLEKLLEEDE